MSALIKELLQEYRKLDQEFKSAVNKLDFILKPETTLPGILKKHLYNKILIEMDDITTRIHMFEYCMFKKHNLIIRDILTYEEKNKLIL